MVDETQTIMRRRVRKLHDFLKEALKLSDFLLTDPEDITKKVTVDEWLEKIEKIAVKECFDDTNISVITGGIKALIAYVQDVISRNVDDQFEKAVQVFRAGDIKIEKLSAKVTKKDSQIEKLNEELKEKVAEIDKLNKQIEQNQASYDKEIETLNNTIKARNAKIEKLDDDTGFGLSDL